MKLVLDVKQNREVRLLALACYKNNEGFRLVYACNMQLPTCRAWTQCRERSSARAENEQAKTTLFVRRVEATP